MKTRQWSTWLAAVAVAGLAAAAFTSSGVSAEFHDSAEASASIQVGSFNCSIDSSDQDSLTFSAGASGDIPSEPISWHISPQTSNGATAELSVATGLSTTVTIDGSSVTVGNIPVEARFTLTATCHEAGAPNGFSASDSRTITATYPAEAQSIAPPPEGKKLLIPLPEPDPICTNPQTLKDGECVDPPIKQQEDPEPPTCDDPLDENDPCTPPPPAENCPEPDPDGNCVINDPEVTP